MNNNISVSIIGGGLAGLSAAVHLIKKGFEVSIFEAANRFGGRIYTYFNDSLEMKFDNGKHLMAGWYLDTFEFLKIIDSYKKLKFQKYLSMNLIDKDNNWFNLTYKTLRFPFNPNLHFLKYSALNYKDKSVILKLLKYSKSTNNDNLENKNAYELLLKFNTSQKSIDYFWEILSYSIFNAKLSELSAQLFLNLFRIILNNKKYSALVFPSDFLDEVFIAPSVRFIKENGGKIFPGSAVKNIVIGNNKVLNIILNNSEKIHSDYFISSVPFNKFDGLFDSKDYIKYFGNKLNFKNSAIVVVNIVFNNEIKNELFGFNDYGMLGMVGTVVQWIFKYTNKNIQIVISSAQNIKDDNGNSLIDLTSDEIFNMCYDELKKIFPDFANNKVSFYSVIKEKSATFLPDADSLKKRLKHKTLIDNFFIAGDWTDTGIPATIESAVKSGKKCEDLIYNCSFKN
ncbi:MAG: FAD-binding protein [Ignavibacteria bacterium]|nr:FAD-binding protein [Ignavibacteria bacterium]